MNFRVVIPARYASTRLPGKVLLDILGRPMIQWVYERAARSGAQEVLVATDDERVKQACEGFGADVVMTGSQHRSGTERLAEVAERLGLGAGEVVVNVQADEPALPPELIRQVAANLQEYPDAAIATLCEPIQDAESYFDPNVVKVVTDDQGFALYFSRAPIPWQRDSAVSPGGGREWPGPGACMRHVGLYGYRVNYLSTYSHYPQCAIERIESLEQLRALHYGYRVHVQAARVPPGLGVDTQADLEQVRRLLAVGVGEASIPA